MFSYSYGSGTLTSVFLDRVFSECLTYDGEMDYKTYLDFVLALENRQEPQSLHYLFRILDFEHNGYLTSFTLNYFFKVNIMCVCVCVCINNCRLIVMLQNVYITSENTHLSMMEYT